MTENTIASNLKADTRVETLPAPRITHVPFDLPVTETPERQAPYRESALESAPECYEIYDQRAFSKSAQEELRAGNAFEQKVWIVLGLCSAVTILYAAFCFFIRD